MRAYSSIVAILVMTTVLGLGCSASSNNFDGSQSNNSARNAARLADTAASQANVQRAIDYALQLVGAPYSLWMPGVAIGEGPPAWAKNAPPPDPALVRRQGLFCAAVANLMLRAVGKPIPRAGVYFGGTLAYSAYYKSVMEPFNASTTYPPGTLVGRHYRDTNDQGHVAVIIDNRDTLIQSNGDGCNTRFTIATSEDGYYEYAIRPQNWLY